MHELSIALELVAQLETLASEHGLARIESLTLEAGELRGIVPEALQLAFREAAMGGVAEGAALELEIVPARARCGACGAEFEPAVNDYRCQRCGLAQAELLAGDEILLRSVSGREAPHAGEGETDAQDQRGQERSRCQ